MWCIMNVGVEVRDRMKSALLLHVSHRLWFTLAHAPLAQLVATGPMQVPRELAVVLR